jgi:transcription initiation factor TFIIE subunit alpha
MSSNATPGNSAGASGDQEQVAHEIPADLRLLIRTIMRTFYGFELYLCMEMLMLYPCVKEDDLADLLRLDLKTVQQHLKNLKKEKFLNEKALMETSNDGSKQSKHAYFFINYKMLVNIVKYKLDKIRQQIETEDKSFTTRAQFKCTQCHKTYTDLDTKVDTHFPILLA